MQENPILSWAVIDLWQSIRSTATQPDSAWWDVQILANTSVIIEV